MAAEHISLGEPAHDAERQGLRYLVEGLPEHYTVYSNAWLVERTGVVHELDAVVVAPHGIYVVELKAYRGTVSGTDHDWNVPPAPIRSPLKKNRHTAQVLSSELRRRSMDAGRRWVDHFIFLSHADRSTIRGDASRDRIHLRDTILDALQDAEGFAARCARPTCPNVDKHTRRVIKELLVGQDTHQRPRGNIREWKLLSTIERTERWQEHRVRHALSEKHAVLRVYPLSSLDDSSKREQLLQKLRWEAQVLHRVSQHEAILAADPLFEEPEVGLCLPLEDFPGLTLPTWIDQHHDKLTGKDGLRERVRLWRLLASAVQHAHAQGVVHRLLRPEAVLIEDVTEGAQLRLTGFDLAKQLNHDRTVLVTTLQDDRLRWAAPEVLQQFSDARAYSDQWGLGIVLAWLLTRRPLFDSTQARIRQPGLLPSVTHFNALVPRSLDEAIQRMLALRPADRFSSIEEAVSAVEAAVEGRRGVPQQPVLESFNPEELAPETRLNNDYEIRAQLGSGGLSTVYQALHLVSGRHRALKVARATTQAEEALTAEYEALMQLGEHPNVVRAIDTSQQLVPGRLVMVMERVRGVTLSKWLEQHPAPDREAQQRYAEHLISALEFLESKGVVHKDLKPDNLMVDDTRLTVIDFSLAGHPKEAILNGTALYRDPGLTEWDPGADRYAAALILHELYTGRHPFDGRVPFPDETPKLDHEDFDSPGLYRFFERALHPVRTERFATAREMRDFFRSSLGQKAIPTSTPTTPVPVDTDAPVLSASSSLSASPLSGTALSALSRVGVGTLGELVALDDLQLSSIKGLGKKKREEIQAFRAQLIAQGLKAPERSVPRRVLFAEALDDLTDLSRLDIPATLYRTLLAAGFTTVGRLAAATSDELAVLKGVGPKSVAQLVGALDAFVARSREDGQRRETLLGIWEAASRQLTPFQRSVIDGTFGLFQLPVEGQGQLAEALEAPQAEVSRALNEGLEKMDRAVLEPVAEALILHLEVTGGVLTLPEASQGLEESWLADEGLQTAGLLRLVQRLFATRIQLEEGFEVSSDGVLIRAPITADALRRFNKTATELASWEDEPTEANAARRMLREVLPFYDADRLALATRLNPAIQMTPAGELFIAPVLGRDALRYVLRRARLPLKLEALRSQLDETFGENGHAITELEALPTVLAEVLPDYRVDHDAIVAVREQLGEPARPQEDPLPADFRVPQKTYAEALTDHLRQVATGRGYRLVVTPPEQHPEIARSMAKALPAATYVSFESRLLELMEPEFEKYEAAERSKAARFRLKRAAETLTDTLLREHGRHGQVVVVGDTGVLGVCDAAQEVVRQIYNRVTERDLGCWFVVIPGTVHNVQPLFNEKTPVLKLQHIRVPEPLPEPAQLGAAGSSPESTVHVP